MKQYRLGAIALTLVCAAAGSPLSAQATMAPACAGQPVVNGLRHLDSAADIAAAESLCGITDPVDSAPDVAAAIDDINRRLRGARP